MVEIFVCCELTDTQRKKVQSIAGGTPVHFYDGVASDSEIKAAFARSEIVFGNIEPEWIIGADALRWVQLESVGFGEYTSLNWDKLAAQVSLTNLAGFFAEPVAESILAGILALHRGVDRIVRLQSKHTWSGDALRPTLKTLAGETVLLFGYGSINKRVAQLLSPFNCTINYFGSNWKSSQLDDALPSADVIVCTAPETPATINVFDASRFNRCKSDALFVNFGRGSVVVDHALFNALSEGRLGGAVIDVTREEPLPDDHPFWSCPNMILTQHSGGGSEDEMDRKIDVFEDNLKRYRNGQPLHNEVDFQRGY